MATVYALSNSSTLSKLLNGTLDVASTLPYPELRTHLLNLKFEHLSECAFFYYPRIAYHSICY